VWLRSRYLSGSIDLAICEQGRGRGKNPRPWHIGRRQFERAHTAPQIVIWYAKRLWTLRVLLFALPCIMLFSGCVALRTRNRDTEQHRTQRSRPIGNMDLLIASHAVSQGSTLASNLSNAELRFHPTKEMRLSGLLGPQHPVAVRTLHPRREGRHQRSLRDKLRKKIG
jgi:hypothetical protein